MYINTYIHPREAQGHGTRDMGCGGATARRAREEEEGHGPGSRAFFFGGGSGAKLGTQVHLIIVPSVASQSRCMLVRLAFAVSLFIPGCRFVRVAVFLTNIIRPDSCPAL